MTNELAPVDKLETDAGSYLADARSFQITTLEDQRVAAELLHQIKARIKRVTEFFTPLKRSADAHKKSILDKEKEHLTPLEDAERLLKEKSGAFFAEQERERLALLQAAQEKAEAEELARVEAEAKALKKDGQKAAAKELLAQPIIVSVEAPPEPEKVQGITARTTYDFVIVDPNLIPREYLVPDVVKIRKIVAAMKDQTRIAGIRVTISKSISVR